MEALGIDLRSLLFQALNFAVLLGGLGYFLYKPLARLLAERQEKITASLEAAERLQKEVLAKEAAQAAELNAARIEAQGIINDARSQAKLLQARLEEEVKAQAERLLKQAVKEAEEEKARAHRELREELVETILGTTEKLLQTEMSDPGLQAEHTRKLVKQLHP